MHKISIYSFLFLTILFLSPAEDYAFGMEDIVVHAEVFNDEILGANATLRQSYISRLNAWAQLIPSARVAGMMQWNNDESILSSIGGAEKHDWSLMWEFSAQFDLAPAMFPAISLAYLDYEQKGLSVKETKRRIERDIRKMYLDILFFEQNVNLLGDQLEIASQRRDDAQTSFNSGFLDETTLLQSELQVATLSLEYSRLQEQLNYLLAQFRLMLGMSSEDRLTLSDDLSAYAFNESDFTNHNFFVLPPRTDLNIFDVRIEQLKKSRQMSYLQMLPMLSIGYSLRPAFTADPLTESWFDGDSWSDTSGTFTFTILQRLDPFIPIRNEWSSARKTNSQLEVLQKNRQTLESRARVQIQNLVQSILSGQQAIKARELNVNLALRAYELAQEAYSNGTLTFDRLQQSELDYRSAQRDFLREHVSLLKNGIDLSYEMELPLSNFMLYK